MAQAPKIPVQVSFIEVGHKSEVVILTRVPSLGEHVCVGERVYLVLSVIHNPLTQATSGEVAALLRVKGT